MIGLGLLSTLSADTSTAKVIGYQIIAGFGFGFIFSPLYFPVLAPQKLSTVSYALSFFAFLRLFAQVCYDVMKSSTRTDCFLVDLGRYSRRNHFTE